MNGLAIFTKDAQRVGEHLELGDIRAVAWIDDRRVVCGGDGQRVFVCDATSTTVLETLRVHTSQIKGVAVLNDTHLVSGAVRDGIRLVPLVPEDAGMTAISAHDGPAFELEYHPDGAQIATSGRDGKAVIWDALTLEPLQRLQPHQSVIVWDVAWNATGIGSRRSITPDSCTSGIRNRASCYAGKRSRLSSIRGSSGGRWTNTCCLAV